MHPVAAAEIKGSQIIHLALIFVNIPYRYIVPASDYIGRILWMRRLGKRSRQETIADLGHPSAGDLLILGLCRQNHHQRRIFGNI